MSYHSGYFCTYNKNINCVVGGSKQANLKGCLFLTSDVSYGANATNCIFVSDRGGVTDQGQSCVFKADKTLCAVDPVTARPLAGSSLIVDRFDADYRQTVLPACMLAYCEDGKDGFGGGRRVYNVKQDLGAGEYDWRIPFAKKLGRYLTIAEMGSAVVEDADSGLDIPAGESLELDLGFVVPGACVISTMGMCSVSADGQTVQPTAEGRYAVVGIAGETVHVRIVATGVEGVRVIRVDMPRKGLFLVVK